MAANGRSELDSSPVPAAVIANAVAIGTCAGQVNRSGGPRKARLHRAAPLPRPWTPEGEKGVIWR